MLLLHPPRAVVRTLDLPCKATAAIIFYTVMSFRRLRSQTESIEVCRGSFSKPSTDSLSLRNTAICSMRSINHYSASERFCERRRYRRRTFLGLSHPCRFYEFSSSKWHLTCQIGPRSWLQLRNGYDFLLINRTGTYSACRKHLAPIVIRWRRTKPSLTL